MKRTIIATIILMSCLRAAGQDLHAMENKRVLLPNGWGLTPVGNSLPLGDLPLNIAVSLSQKWAAVTNNGQSVQTIQLINTRTGRLADSIVIPRSWMGLVFSADGKNLYASGGNDNRILQYTINNGHLKLADSFQLADAWPKREHFGSRDCCK